MSKSKVLTEDPRQQILFKGILYLSDAENLSVIISGRDALNKAKNLLAKVSGNYQELSRLSYNEMVREGLSYTQATRVIASSSYAQRKACQIADEKIHVRSSKDAHDIMKPILEDLSHEEFWIMFLNRSNKIIGKIKISQGGISGTVTDMRLIMKRAIEFLASGLIVCHNHPSGNNRPSESDIQITQKIREAGALMDIQLLDHIIIADQDYYSFADDGVL